MTARVRERRPHTPPPPPPPRATRRRRRPPSLPRGAPAVCKAVIDAIDKELTVKDRETVETVEKKMQGWCDTAKGKDKTMVRAQCQRPRRGLRRVGRAGGGGGGGGSDAVNSDWTRELAPNV